jgi:ribose transport system ATP-binding protein
LAEATPLEQVAVAIVAAIQSCDHPRSVLVLDEPTAILPSGEVHRLFKFIKELTSRGTGVLYVSHRLDEIFEIADRVTVLREGKRVATRPVEGMTKPRLVSLMLGQDLVLGNKRRETVSVETPVVLEAKGLRSRYLKGVDLALRQGEIVGLAGLPGSGREELPYALAGALSPSAIGKIRTPGSNGEWIDIEQAGDFGVTLVPANRATEGIISEMSIGENLSLMVLDRLGRRGRLNIASEKAAISQWLTRLDVRGPDFRHGVSTLSGGNQQKVLIGRCLAIEPKVLALCEPTAGVDIGARSAIFDFLLASARSGLSVLIASSDLDDLLATCDRVLVMRHGIVATELEGSSITARGIVHAMEGLDETLA